MKHLTFAKATALLAMAVIGMSASAQPDTPLRLIRAVKPAVQVNMLDSVKGENYKKIYRYNDYGYITSVMVYHKDSEWTLDTGASYLQDYVFNADGQCTARTRYKVDEQGKRTVVDDKGELVVKDGLTWEYIYSRHEDGKLHPETAKAYDKWGNLAVDMEYGTDWLSYEDYISSYEESRYSGATHPGTCDEESFVQAYRTYYVKSSQSGTRTLDVDELLVGNCEMTVWEQSGGKLYRRFYTPDYGDVNVTVGNVKEHLSLVSEDVYELNADGTRPVNKTSTSISGSESTVTGYEEYTWDGKNRLLGYSHSGSYKGDVEYKYTYTYADDYAKEMSLTDAVCAVDYGLRLYPEDECCTFGRLATQCSEHKECCGESEGTDKEEVTYTWNDEGQMYLAKWKETDQEYNDNSGTWEETVEEGEEHCFYNADNHMSHLISVEHGDGSADEYVKIEFVYDPLGRWTGEKEYSGDSFDGPWHAVNGYNKVRARRSVRKPTAFIGDMSDGYHEISSSDGVFQTRGFYQVEDGTIVYGDYNQYIVNTASVPQNPEWNYTEPSVPFGIADEVDYDMANGFWYYRWNSKTQEWQCVQTPDFARHIYYSGDDIVCDTYNADKEITSTVKYSFDGDGRLKKQSGDGCEVVYTYLSDGSDYLLETVTTTSGVSSVLRYYYSLHDYVSPTGIDSATAADGDDTVFDLQGRRVTSPSAHGIYIVNGRKVVK